MKKARMVWLAASLVLLLTATHLAGQDQERKTRVYFGPCLGVGSVVLDGDTFNSRMQALYPADKWYFPVFTQMGIEAGQIIPISGTGGSFAFHELLLLGGLEQGMPMPLLDVLFGFEFPFGLELSVGPYFAVMAPTGSTKLVMSAVVAVGWSLRFQSFTVPIKLTYAPMPAYDQPQLSLLVGFGFEGLE